MKFDVSGSFFDFVSKFTSFVTKGSSAIEKEALEESAKHMVKSTHAGYESERDGKGRSWPELSPAYKHKPYTKDGLIVPPNRPVDQHPEILVNYGDMKKSITWAFENDKSVLIGYANDKQALKALIHQKGKKNTLRIQTGLGIKEIQVTPPVRETLDFSEWAREGNMNDVDTILKIFSDRMFGQLEVLIR